MKSPPQTIVIRVSEHEYALIAGLAELCGMTVSDAVRELIGFEPADQRVRGPQLKLIPA
jgi:hypothetical protein